MLFVVGPVMVLEFCEMGQLDSWLLKQNGKADEETMEKLYRFSRDIACGMSYLASKKVRRERTVLDIPRQIDSRKDNKGGNNEHRMRRG